MLSVFSTPCMYPYTYMNQSRYTRIIEGPPLTDLPTSYHLCIPLNDLLNPSFYPSTSFEGHDGPTPLCQFPQAFQIPLSTQRSLFLVLLRFILLPSATSQKVLMGQMSR